MAPKTRKDTEWAWYATRSGINHTTNTPLVEMQHAYWAKAVGGARTGETATDLQVRWLHTLTGVGANTKALPDLWREAVVGAGGKAANDINENKFIYYTIVP